MTKAVTLLAMLCVLIAGTSAATILARESLPAAGAGFADAAIDAPVTNRESKTDKLLMASAEASAPDIQFADNAVSTQDAALQDAVVQDASSQEFPAQAATDGPAPALQKPVQFAYAGDVADGFSVGALPETAGKIAAPATRLPAVIATAPVEKPKPPARPKPPALLSDAQITQLKGRLNLSSSQEYYWPSVEQALRAIGRRLHAARYVAESGPPPIDPDSAEVQQLKYAAMPLLFQLREDQKQEVRKLARAMGLEQVAQAI